MTQKILLPNRFKRIGWFILIPSAIIGIILIIFDFETLQINSTVFAIYSDESLLKTGNYFHLIKTDITNTLIGVLFIIGIHPTNYILSSKF